MAIKATLGDSTLAVQVRPSVSAISDDTDIYLVDLATGAVRSRNGAPSQSMRLLANGVDYVLVGASKYITGDSETQFESLRRLDISNAP
jgi:hypothetical protein